LRLDPDDAVPSFATDAYESNALMSGLASCRLPLGCFVLAPLPDLVPCRSAVMLQPARAPRIQTDEAKH
jgi:hypothetical protein